MPVGAWAAENVDYLDGEGQAASANATLISGNTEILSEGWYYAEGNVTLSNLTLTGAASIILADNCMLTVKGGFIAEGENQLTVYSRSFGNNMGQLKVEKGGIGRDGTITISGGSGMITISGGNVSARVSSPVLTS